MPMKQFPTRFIVIILLIVYGVALALVSYKIFNNQNKVIVQSRPPEEIDSGDFPQAMEKVLTSKAPDLNLRLKSNGEILLTSYGQEKINVAQFSVEIPYSEEMRRAKGEMLIPGFNNFYNQTVVDDAKQKITVNMAGYTLGPGFNSSKSPSVVARITLDGKPLSLTNLKFNRSNTKVIGVGVPGGLLVEFTD
jgi:hypothetical protein